MTRLLIANVSLPAEVEEALDKRTSMNVLGNMQQYSQFQAANAIETSAQTGGGNPALDFGVGIAMGQQLMNNMQPQASAQTPAQPPGQPTAPATPPPVSTAPAEWHMVLNGQQAGPFTRAQLRSQGLSRTTLVWKAGMANWLAASEVTELADLFNNMPPPIPGA